MEHSPASMSAYTKAETAGAVYALEYGFTWTPPSPGDPDGELVPTGDGDGDRIGWLEFEVNGPEVQITVTYTASLVCHGPFVGYLQLARAQPARQQTTVEIVRPPNNIVVRAGETVTIEARWSTTVRGKPGAPSDPPGRVYRVWISVTNQFGTNSPSVDVNNAAGSFTVNYPFVVPGVHSVKSSLYVSDGKRWRRIGRSSERQITVRAPDEEEGMGGDTE